MQLTPIRPSHRRRLHRWAAYPRPTHDSDSARALRRLTGRGWCFRCGNPWSLPHEESPGVEPFDDEHGFCLCTTCWAECSLDQRLYYYDRLVNMWVGQMWEIGEDPSGHEARRERVLARVRELSA